MTYSNNAMPIVQNTYVPEVGCGQYAGCQGLVVYRLTSFRYGQGEILSCAAHAQSGIDYNPTYWTRMDIPSAANRSDMLAGQIKPIDYPYKVVGPLPKAGKEWTTGTGQWAARDSIDILKEAISKSLAIQKTETKILRKVHIESGNPLAVVCYALLMREKFLRDEAEANAYSKSVERVRRTNRA